MWQCGLFFSVNCWELPQPGPQHTIQRAMAKWNALIIDCSLSWLRLCIPIKIPAWDSQLPKALFAYRTAVYDTTGFTPFHLTFVRFPQLPVDVILGHALPVVCSRS